MPDPTHRRTALAPRPATVRIPLRDGRAYKRLPSGDVDSRPVEVWYFADLLVEDTLQVLELEDLIVEAKEMKAQLALAREQVALLCPDLDSGVIQGLSPAVLRELRTLGFRDPDGPAGQEGPAQPAARPRPAGSASPSAPSPEPAGSSASRRGAASAA